MRCAFSFARFGLWIHRQFATESNEYNVILTVMNQRHLFNDADWSSVEQHQQKLLSDEILQSNSQRILTSSLEDLVDYLAQKYALHVPQLQKEHATADQQEREIDISGDRSRYWSSPGPHFVRGTEVSLAIPFSGDPDFFKTQPNTYTQDPPRGEIRDQMLILRVTGTNLDRAAVRQQLDHEISKIETYLTNLHSSVDLHNASIRERARQQLNARRTKLLADQNLVAELGYPLRERQGAPRTYAAPEIRRVIKPSLPPQGTQPFKPEPVLTSKDYEHILGVLQNMAEVMERSPSAFRTMDEESLRSHFLVQLNGHYEGQATGETFNYSGKTDILLRVEDRNIFIGECKFWTGPKKLKETLDQILAYSSWRDTKVAVILFNRAKNFSAVLTNIPAAVEEHPNFKRSIPISGETRFRYVFSHKADVAREMIVTILAFDVPT